MTMTFEEYEAYMKDTVDQAIKAGFSKEQAEFMVNILPARRAIMKRNI